MHILRSMLFHLYTERHGSKFMIQRFISDGHSYPIFNLFMSTIHSKYRISCTNPQDPIAMHMPDRK